MYLGRRRSLGLLLAIAVPLTGCPSQSAHDAGSDVPDAASDVQTVDDLVATDTPVVIETALRAIAPISTEVVSSRRPTFVWTVPDTTPGVVAELCADRACTMVQATLPSTATAAGRTTATPSTDLTPGVHFWRVRSGTVSTPVRELIVSHAHAVGHDGRATWITDVNGDGFADVIAGASHADTEEGRAYVFHGRAGGLASTANTVLEGTNELAGHFGWWIAPAGDVNGDGYGDVVISSPDVSSGTGAVMLYLGSATGLPTMASMTLAAPDPSGNFGAYVSSAGDVNGDGYSDVVVGAPNVDSSRGRVYVYLGGATGLQPAPATTIAGSDGVGGTLGSGVAGVGDVNGDGFADLVLGASGAAATVGAAYLYMGSADGIRSTGGIAIASPSMDSGQFGAAVAGAGDVDGDGFADVVISASGTVNGDVWIYRGAAGGLDIAHPIAIASPDGERGAFGWAVAGLGDVNGDGFDDVVVTSVCAPFHADPDGGYPTCGPGIAHVYNGAATGVMATASATVVGPDGEPASFGWALGSAGDIDGDGFSDVVVGAEATNMFAGSVYVYRGGASGLVTGTPMLELDGPDGVGGNFGWAVALNGPSVQSERTYSTSASRSSLPRPSTLPM